MLKRYQTLSIPLLLASLGVSVLALLFDSSWKAAIAQASDPAVAPWQQIYNFFFQENDPPNDGANRGSRPIAGFCLLSPDLGQSVWHQEPMLVWQGYPMVGIRLQGEATPLWQDAIAAPATKAYRVAKPELLLNPGQTYEWLFYIIDPNAPALQVPFQVMDQAARARHNVELTAIQNKLTTETADESALALAQADYFIANNLPADALQVIFSVEEPTPELLEMQTVLVQTLCP